MLLPAEISRITPLPLSSYNVLKGLNIMEFDEGNDGGGDGYYLYWPLGCEQLEPFVCRFQHEEHLLTVPYRRLVDFLADFETDEGNLSTESFFYYPYAQAKLRFRKGQTEQAVEKLLTCVDSFPEFSDAWTLLAAAYQQLNNEPEAAAAVRRAVLSAWQFGRPSTRCLTIFQNIKIPPQLAQDPLLLNRKALLSASSYQQGASNDYSCLWHIVQQYLELRDFESAIRLAQNYGYFMHREPQSRQGTLLFTTNQWLTDLEAIKQNLPS